MGIKYKIDIIAALKEAGYNTSTLRKDKLLSEGVIQALRESKYISLQNVSKICELLDCQPGDLLEYVKEGQCSRKGRFVFMNKITPNTGNIYPVSAPVQVFTKPSVLLNRFRAAARPVRMEDCPHVSRCRLAPCPYHGRNSWMGKERRQRHGKRRFCKLAASFYKKQEAGGRLLHLPPTSKLYSNKNPHTERVSRFPVHFDFLFLLFTASCIDFSNFSAICCPYLSKSTLGAYPRCNLYK